MLPTRSNKITPEQWFHPMTYPPWNHLLVQQPCEKCTASCASRSFWRSSCISSKMSEKHGHVRRLSCPSLVCSRNIGDMFILFSLLVHITACSLLSVALFGNIWLSVKPIKAPERLVVCEGLARVGWNYTNQSHHTYSWFMIFHFAPIYSTILTRLLLV